MKFFLITIIALMLNCVNASISDEQVINDLNKREYTFILITRNHQNFRKNSKSIYYFYYYNYHLINIFLKLFLETNAHQAINIKTKGNESSLKKLKTENKTVKNIFYHWLNSN